MERNFPKGIEVVVGVLIRRPDGKILITKSPNWDNLWGFCGGHVDPGETIFHAAEREAKEETGLEVKAIGTIRIVELINPLDYKRPAHLLAFQVLAECKDPNELKLDDDEVTEYAWVTADEASSYPLASSYAQTLAEYAKSLK